MTDRQDLLKADDRAGHGCAGSGGPKSIDLPNGSTEYTAWWLTQIAWLTHVGLEHVGMPRQRRLTRQSSPEEMELTRQSSPEEMQ